MDGDVIEGTWTMTDFRDFVDFGLAGAPLPAGVRGGILIAEIELDGVGEGRIFIVCALGDFPPGTFDGVEVETEEMDFDTAIVPLPGDVGGGLTVFIDM